MNRYERPLAVARGVLGAIFKRSLYTAGILLTVILLIQLYYIVLPGSWFLRSTDVTIQTAQAGQDVPFDWCRQPLHGNIDATATRTFYKRDGEGSGFRQVSEYTFSLTVEGTPQPCSKLKILASRQPQVDGIYYFVTDLKWRQSGHEKSLRFSSNQYSLIATADSLQNRINDLQSQVDALKARLKALLGTTSAPTSTAPATPTISRTDDATPPAQSAQPTTSGSAGDGGSTTAQPSPTTVQQPSLLDRVLTPVTNLLKLAI